MRYFQQITILAGIALLVVLLSGCASAIYSKGKDKDVLHAGVDRALIVQRFGEPIERSKDKFGRDVELFRANGLIAPDEEDVATFQYAEAQTLGLGDVIWTPAALVWWPFLATGEKEVVVGFDENGKYLYHTVRHARSRPVEQPNTALEPTSTAP